MQADIYIDIICEWASGTGGCNASFAPVSLHFCVLQWRPLFGRRRVPATEGRRVGGCLWVPFAVLSGPVPSLGALLFAPAGGAVQSRRGDYSSEAQEQQRQPLQRPELSSEELARAARRGEARRGEEGGRARRISKQIRGRRRGAAGRPRGEGGRWEEKDGGKQSRAFSFSLSFFLLQRCERGVRVCIAEKRQQQLVLTEAQRRKE